LPYLAKIVHGSQLIVHRLSMQNHSSKNKIRLSDNFDPKAIESKWPFGKAQGKQDYDPGVIEPKWQKVWEEERLYQPDIKRSKNPFYNLMMFPYPSALGLHVGNIYAFVGSDIHGRFKRMQGFEVFEPIGLDGFGIHSENFALKVGEHPMDLSKKTESAIYAQLRAIGNGFAWFHKLETYISDYYKWTQWIFIQLFKRGLAYRAEADVNWCPSCKTVLADEQVVRKSEARNQISEKSEIRNPKSEIWVCERCGTEVQKRKLEQWFFKITNYTDRLLLGLEKIDWSEKVKVAQRNWLGKSEGLLLKFESDIESYSQVEVFTTRPDTLFGVTFMALAPEHPQVIKILDKSKGLLRLQIQKYVTDSIRKPESERIGLAEAENQKAREVVKTGIKTSFHCTNPVTGKRVPIFIADYVLMSYGTGAVMGVPAHDQRDYLFARKYQIDIVEVVKPAGPVGSFPPDTRTAHQISQQTFTDYGVLVNSGEFNGLNSQEAIKAISDFAVKKGFGVKKVMWHLRDWIISRQRYWGAPIPMIFCQSCEKAGKSWFTTVEAKKQKKLPISSHEMAGWPASNTSRSDAGWYPVPESGLPVELPYIKNFKPTGTGVSPLATDPNFVKVKCPDCGSEARRETDVSDTFLDSAWYFLRYPSVSLPENSANQQVSRSVNQSISKSADRKVSKSEIPAYRNAEKQIHRHSEFSENLPWDRQITKRWLPVDMYIGGAEHSVLHLLYSRFLWKVFYDFGYFDFSAKNPNGQLGGPAKMPASGWEEPFSKFRAHGLLISEGAKMSKSKGNVVLPDPYIEKFGADTLRTYLMFCGRFSEGGDFRDTGIEGMHRFLKRVWRLVMSAGPVTTFPPASAQSSQPSKPSQSSEPFDLRAVGGPSSRATRISSGALHLMHKTIKKVSEDIENLRYNTAIAAIMEWVGTLEKRAVGSSELIDQRQGRKELRTMNYELITQEEVRTLLLLLAPFAPYMTEELWSRLAGNQVTGASGKNKSGKPSSIHNTPWPKYDPKVSESEKIELVVQVNGKVRDRIIVDRGIEKEDTQRLVLDLKNTQKYVSGKKPKKVIFVKDRLINIVI